MTSALFFLSLQHEEYNSKKINCDELINAFKNCSRVNKKNTFFDTKISDCELFVKNMDKLNNLNKLIIINDGDNIPFTSVKNNFNKIKINENLEFKKSFDNKVIFEVKSN